MVSTAHLLFTALYRLKGEGDLTSGLCWIEDPPLAVVYSGLNTLTEEDRGASVTRLPSHHITNTNTAYTHQQG